MEAMKPSSRMLAAEYGPGRSQGHFNTAHPSTLLPDYYWNNKSHSWVQKSRVSYLSSKLGRRKRIAI